MTNKQPPLVSIHCLTYNHKDYITQAIESFLMQETNHSFEVVISEDCSTDGTREIVFDYAIKYPELIRVVTSDENVGMNQNSYRGLMACKGKYIAFCEGDDYWIDPLKLQKQVDFLELNPEYGMIHSDLHEYNTIKKTWRKNIWKDMKLFQEGDIFNSLIIGRTTGIYTCTSMLRKNLLLDKMTDFIGLNLAMGDTFTQLSISSKSKIGYINQATAVRQLLENSATQGIDFEKKKHFAESGTKLRNYFSQRIQVEPEIMRLAEISSALRYLEVYRKHGKKDEFKKAYLSFRKSYFEWEAELSKIASRGKYPYYFSRIVTKLIIKLNLDFRSKVHRKLRKKGLIST